MKKAYIQPKTKAVNVKASEILCSSPDTPDYRGDDGYSGDKGIDVD